MASRLAQKRCHLLNADVSAPRRWVERRDAPTIIVSLKRWSSIGSASWALVTPSSCKARTWSKTTGAGRAFKRRWHPPWHEGLRRPHQSKWEPCQWGAPLKPGAALSSTVLRCRRSCHSTSGAAHTRVADLGNFQAKLLSALHTRPPGIRPGRCNARGLVAFQVGPSNAPQLGIAILSRLPHTSEVPNRSDAQGQDGLMDVIGSWRISSS